MTTQHKQIVIINQRPGAKLTPRQIEVLNAEKQAGHPAQIRDNCDIDMPEVEVHNILVKV